MVITVVEVNRIIEYPPVITLIRILLKQGHTVNLISRGCNDLPKDLIDTRLNCFDFEYNSFASKISKATSKIKLRKYVQDSADECMKSSDILWTTSANTIKVLGKQVLKYKNVLQLMELVESLQLIKGHFDVPIAEIARKSWRVVVPEINRAFIEQTWWNLSKLPFVLPNKPFDLNPGSLSDDTKIALQKIKEDTSKKIIYLGGIWPDRDLTMYAKAAQEAEDYKLYIIGNPYGSGEKHLNELVNKYDAVYLGGFSAPQHLAFLPYAKVGLLPYKATKSQDVSILNALYCAPNKIYEYAGFGIPMIGSYVPGLLLPFQQYNIGLCCKNETVRDVLDNLKIIEDNYHEMSTNCFRFYEDTDNELTVKTILAE